LKTLGLVLASVPLVVGFYSFAGYPLLLSAAAKLRRKRAPVTTPTGALPLVSISLPVYNEEAQIRDVVNSLLAIDYPKDRLQIVVVSDASSDRTDDIVREYADRGVELLRLPGRSGKTAAENAAAAILRGEIVVNTDASIRIQPDAVRKLVAQFADPTIGVASGRDISVSGFSGDANVSEAGYVNYEMRVRKLETEVNGIIGASGCFYAVRVDLHRQPLPEHLSRDFASALIAREHGYRAVSVDDALCLVPRTISLHREFRRKVRTMSRGMETLVHKGHLLNPFRYGTFAWMLFSHKVCRWSTPVAGILGIIGLALLVPDYAWARWLLAGIGVMAALALAGWQWPNERAPRALAILAGAASAQVATLWSMIRAMHGDQNAAWEPTRREMKVAHPESA
jgi:cellulose synthase/poly-beta-1,6-N-acetylglucosamine synthase-like glycosyltransferase